MKKNAKIINLDQIEPRTPSGGGGLWQRLINVGDTESGLVFGFGRIKPGDSRGWHEHPAGEDSISYVVEGDGLAEWKHQGKINQQKISAECGRLGVSYTAIGTGDDPIDFIARYMMRGGRRP